IRPGPEPTPISQLLADLPAPGPFSGEPSAFDPEAETVAPPLPRRRPPTARAAVAPPTTELPLFVRDLPGAAAAPVAAVLPEPVSPASVPAGREEPGPAGRAAGEPASSLSPPQAGHRQTPDRQPPRRPTPSRRIGPLDRDLLED